MITASAALVNLLNSSNQFYMADLYTIALTNGVTLQYTNADRNILSGGQTFRSDSLLIKRDRVRQTTGIEVDELNLTINFDGVEVITNGLTFPQMLTRGLLDSAKVTLERAFFTSFRADVITGLLPAPTGTIKRFIGKVSEISYGRTEAQIIIKSELECLNIQMPRNLIQSPCIWTLCDNGCGLSHTNFKHTGTVAAGSTNALIKATLPQADGWGDLGYLVFTSGLNNGIKRTIKEYKGGQVKPIVPFPQPVSVGDTFEVYAGCDKKMETCIEKFNNLVNFRGCPYVPVPEVAL